jgi:hypothetical protein
MIFGVLTPLSAIFQDCYDIDEILLEVALSTIIPNP